LTAPVRPLRSFLFVPATRPERYAKALASGADLVCVDLEDAVAPAEKEQARAGAAALLASDAWEPARSSVRVNPPGGPLGRDDLSALLEAARGGPAAGRLLLSVPKVDGPEVLADVRRRAAEAGVRAERVALVETAAGLRDVERIAGADGVAALFFGGLDLALELGCAPEWEPLLYARSRVVHAAALAGVPAIDVPFVDVADADGLAAEARGACRLGFAGKGAIHPAQVEPIHAAFAPDPAEVERARNVLREHERHGGSVFLLDGRMVDRPVVEAARRVLARAGAWSGAVGPAPTREESPA